MRIRRGLATEKEIETFSKRAHAGRFAGYAAGGWPYYLMPDGGVVSSAGSYLGARILRRAERRLLVGIRQWRKGTRAPTRIDGPYP